MTTRRDGAAVAAAFKCTDTGRIANSFHVNALPRARSRVRCRTRCAASSKPWMRAIPRVRPGAPLRLVPRFALAGLADRPPQPMRAIDERLSRLAQGQRAVMTAGDVWPASPEIPPARAWSARRQIFAW